MPTLNRHRRKYLPDHLNNRRTKPHGDRKLYRLEAWKQDSEDYRRQNPLCEVCKQMGKYVDVTPGGRKGVTDHIISTTVGGSQRDRRNFMSMCQPCHNRKRGYESQAGGPLIETIENEDGDLIPKDRTEIFELWH